MKYGSNKKSSNWKLIIPMVSGLRFVSNRLHILKHSVVLDHLHGLVLKALLKS